MPLVLRLTDFIGRAWASVDELEDLRVDRGFAAGEHHHLGLALRRDERVEHPPHCSSVRE